MKSLIHICEEADQALNYLGAPKGTLEKEAQDWIYDDMKILAYRISVKNSNLIIVVSELDEAGQEKFSVFRFFPMNNKWVTSADLTSKSKESTIQFLLNHFE